MKKRFPAAFVIGAVSLAILLAIFLVRKSAITGSFAAIGDFGVLDMSFLSAGMIAAIAAGAILLIVIFAGIGKQEL